MKTPRQALTSAAVGLLALLFTPVATAAGPAQAAKQMASTAGAAPAAATRTPRVISMAELKELLARRNGRVLVLHLWASWCVPCLDELPAVGRFARKVAPGVEVVSLSLDEPAPASFAAITRLLDRVEATTGASLTRTVATLDDPDAFIAAVDPTWGGDIPALFVFDARGRRRGSHVGLAGAGDLEALVRAARPAR